MLLFLIVFQFAFIVPSFSIPYQLREQVLLVHAVRKCYMHRLCSHGNPIDPSCCAVCTFFGRHIEQKEECVDEQAYTKKCIEQRIRRHGTLYGKKGHCFNLFILSLYNLQIATIWDEAIVLHIFDCLNVRTGSSLHSSSFC